MGLIAREIEAAGIPTLSMSSALSITAAVRPPRAVFLDYPLGHTSGKPNEPELQDQILRATLSAFENASTPGEIVELGFPWSDSEAWKADVVKSYSVSGDGSGDNRSERNPEPQYQCEQDRVVAERQLPCETCVFLEAAPV